MEIYRDNLTSKQADYSLFLPSLSTFYSGLISKQRFSDHIAKSRIPSRFENGIEGLNFINPQEGYFHYKWLLYSAGHANLDPSVFDPTEEMIRKRDRNNSFVLADSGGYQVSSCRWPGDWRAHSTCPNATLKRDQVLDWMETYMDYGMALDIPVWVINSQNGREKTKIETYEDALEGSKYNFEYWIKRRKGNCKLLNVLQGNTHEQADHWYGEVKKYADPKHFPNEHFNGWAMGGQNKCDLHLVLRRLVALIHDGLLTEGVQDWVHYLGTGKLEWAMIFTDIQRAIRKYHNPKLTISFDCASPFLTTANGNVYWKNSFEDNQKWSTLVTKCIDDKKYSTDTRMFRDAVVQDGVYSEFISSPLIDRVQINEICYYNETALNKIGKIGKTSWDSFAYAILMGHNTYAHIKAVQDGNVAYDSGKVPSMLIHNLKSSKDAFRQLVDAIFSAKTYAEAMRIVDSEHIWYTQFLGYSPSGLGGRKAINPLTMANKHFILDSVPTKTVKKDKQVATPIIHSDLFEH